LICRGSKYVSRGRRIGSYKLCWCPQSRFADNSCTTAEDWSDAGTLTVTPDATTNTDEPPTSSETPGSSRSSPEPDTSTGEPTGDDGKDSNAFSGGPLYLLLLALTLLTFIQ